MNSVDASLYFTVLRAIFIEIMLPFSPGVSSEDDLNFKASKIARRLQAGPVSCFGGQCLGCHQLSMAFVVSYLPPAFILCRRLMCPISSHVALRSLIASWYISYRELGSIFNSSDMTASR